MYIILFLPIVVFEFLENSKKAKFCLSKKHTNEQKAKDFRGKIAVVELRRGRALVVRNRSRMRKLSDLHRKAEAFLGH